MEDGASEPTAPLKAPALGLALLVLGCAPSPPPAPAAAQAARPARPTPPPAASSKERSKGLSAAELLALPDEVEFSAWAQDPRKPPARPPQAPEWELELPVDEHGAEWWPMVAAFQGLDGPAFAEERHVAVRFADRPFAIPPGGGRWTGDRPTPEQLRVWLPAAEGALSQYPAQLLAAARIEHFVLVRDLKFGGASPGGVSIGSAGVIITNAADYADTALWERERHLHHEVFHALDYADDGDTWTDDAWAALNAPGVAYGNGALSMLHIAGVGAWDDDREGFLTRYATSAVPEDKAEVFAWMMTDLPRVEARAARDPVLAKKVAQMKRLCAAFSPHLDEGFWSIRRLQARSTRD